MRRILVLAAFAAICLSLYAGVGYQRPPKEILDVLNAPASPSTFISPDKSNILLMARRLYPGIEELAAPVHRIAGLRINPANNGPHAPGLVFTGITLLNIDSGKQTRIAVPPGARLGPPAWSPDGKRFAVANSTANSIDLYLGSLQSAALRRVPGVKLIDTVGDPFAWWSGSRELLVQAVPANRGPAPKPPPAPSGPNVQESSGRSGPVRTYQDMLTSPHDEALFDYYCTAQLAAIDFTTLKVTPVGKPAIFAEAEPAPDGKHLLAGFVQRPYSYVHGYYSFPRETVVWDRSGKTVFSAHKRGLLDTVPIEGVATGPRNISWRPNEPATLLWWEALDNGDPKVKAPNRDKLMMTRAPFSNTVEVTRTVHRAMGVLHGEGGLALVSDYDRNRRWITATRIFLDDRNAEPRTVWSRSMQDRYGNPGRPLMKRLPDGASIIHQSGDFVFLSGEGATPKGDRPFLDRMNIRTWKTERIFQAGERGYESVVGLLADDGSRFVTSYEDPLTPPNLMIRVAGGDERTPITSFTDTTPQLRQIKQQLVTYKRADGVQLSFTLFLPPGYKEGTRLPTILYAYPLEYNDADTAGQIGGSTQRFVQMRGASHLFLLLNGYAILNNATIPIVGDPETVNNTYVEQLVASAKAAIDKAVEMGVTDPGRVGVTGHSYGGFMTANLLAHCDLFRTGVARSGAYNRTLTPFGFQSERRTFWEARDVYMKMSPFTWSDKINEPILLIHGEADNNPGTFPVQSDRLYQAVRGNGGTVRLVFLPFEAHGYAASQSLEHVLWETQTWFDRYLRNAK
jgi:dipeptidyl aminopeptidase/acylaminoacyl peptidase